MKTIKFWPQFLVLVELLEFFVVKFTGKFLNEISSTLLDTKVCLFYAIKLLILFYHRNYRKSQNLFLKLYRVSKKMCDPFSNVHN